MTIKRVIGEIGRVRKTRRLIEKWGLGYLEGTPYKVDMVDGGRKGMRRGTSLRWN